MQCQQEFKGIGKCAVSGLFSIFFQNKLAVQKCPLIFAVRF